LPLFTPVSTSPYQANTGNGANASYNIVQFVGITVIAVPAGQSGVWVQAGPIMNPNFVFATGSISPAGTGATFTTTFLTPKTSHSRD
jgi:hypothetical protein